VIFFIPTALGYAVLAFVLKKQPPELYKNAEEEAFWRGVATAPDDTFTTIRRKFGELENRLRNLETQVTSADFDLRRKFNDLGR
jgi:phage shock protein C